MKIQVKRRITFTFLAIMFTSSMMTIFYGNNEDPTNSDDVESRNKGSLRTSNYWTNFTYIHITAANWSTAAGYDWCSGDGSWSNPYIIENITMDATGSPTGSGIYISNSNNSYFIIRNCTVINAPAVGAEDAGIRLDNTGNGTLIQNNCTSNGRCGISLNYNCQNNSVLFNNVSENGLGIQLYTNCHNNTILGN